MHIINTQPNFFFNKRISNTPTQKDVMFLNTRIKNTITKYYHNNIIESKTIHKIEIEL